MGIDSNRVSLLLAVLERRGIANFLSHDVYINVAGGLQIDEPALDLGIMAALISSQRNKPLPNDLALFGEALDGVEAAPSDDPKLGPVARHARASPRTYLSFCFAMLATATRGSW